ncbi:hypothetical protein CHS0354_013080 [Potamilus streckersoni]|uniref:Sulfotransferase domain-containing protein n=1 Tax=Potamilus streckersoni TaxID=2493646 RepID=A0AAE0SG18_9BIVA|nr:hypothetical protein CHS0354_013080 [Potamilus streckersoni]
MLADWNTVYKACLGILMEERTETKKSLPWVATSLLVKICKFKISETSKCPQIIKFQIEMVPCGQEVTFTSHLIPGNFIMSANKQQQILILQYRCPKLTRIKVISVVTMAVFSMVLIAFYCLQSGIHNRSTVCSLPHNLTTLVTKDFKKSRQKIVTTIPNGFKKSRLKIAHTHRQLPQCLIIGVKKGGTRALLNYLNIHPDVVTASDEIHFFDRNENYNQGFDAYRHEMPFSFKGQITIEKTPAYFTSPKAPKRVFRMNNSMKLLLVVRDPVERTISDYAQVAEGKRMKNKPWELFEDKVIDRKTGQVDKTYSGIQRSIYIRHFIRWLEYFQLSQFHFIDGDNLVRNPYKEVVDVETYLRLDPRIKVENFIFNKTKGFYCVKIDEKEKCLSDSKGRKHPDVDPNVYQKLQHFFHPYNERFFHRIGRRFNWS